ncbi:MAG: radical SAM protein [Deltaproteobacteria bacterium]|nr:radical SAM protein [Deltaproteobacteria bacterium]
MPVRFALISTSEDLSGLSSRLLSAHLRGLGQETRLIYLPSPGPGRRVSPAAAQAVARLCRDADYVGQTVFTSDYYLAGQLAGALREQSPARLIWGGIHPTVRPAECLAHADGVAVGDGEKLLAALAAGQDFHGIPGLRTRENQAINRGPAAPTPDLDTLPAPDFSFQGHYLVDPQEGWAAPLTFELWARRQHQNYTDLAGRPRIYYRTMTTRGCPFNCTYCSNGVYQGLYGPRHFRARSLEQVLAELAMVRAAHPQVELIHFTDDNFFSRRQAEIARFAELYRRDIGLPFYAVGHPANLTPAKLDSLLAAGLVRLSLGLQSGSRTTLRRYGRNTPLSVAANAVKLLESHRRAGRLLPAKYDVILGDPLEPPRETARSVAFLAGLPGRFALHSLLFLPGTALAQEARLAGLPLGPAEEGYAGYRAREKDYFQLVAGLLNNPLAPRLLVRSLARPGLANLSRQSPAFRRFTRHSLGFLDQGHQLLRRSRAWLHRRLSRT